MAETVGPKRIISLPDLTVTRTLEVLREVVEEAGPDYVDPNAADSVIGCRYAEDGRPSCIVGRVLAKLGVSIDVLNECNPHGNLYSLLTGHLIDIPDGPFYVLAAAQTMQDGGQRWTYALRVAEEKASQFTSRSVS